MPGGLPQADSLLQDLSQQNISGATIWGALTISLETSVIVMFRALGACNVFEKCLSSSQALTLRKTSKFGSPRSNSAINFKCLSSMQALTLHKTKRQYSVLIEKQ